VFVDQGYLTEEMINIDFLRWFYTACTRASKALFLVNFDQRFYSTPPPEA
jgi:exodeoxyribonuclease-5